MEREKYMPDIETLVKNIVRDDVPIAKTENIGHGTDSKAILVGKELCLEE